jgi:CRP-like cAMP-binding protein
MPDFFSYQGDTEPAPAAAIGAALSGEDWEHLIRFAARRSFAPGATVLKAGERDPALHFIASGQVELQGPGKTRVLRGEGEVFGVMSFLDGAPSAVSVVVAGPGAAELLRLTPEALQQLAAWQPRLALALMREMGAHTASRLRRLMPAD